MACLMSKILMSCISLRYKQLLKDGKILLLKVVKFVSQNFVLYCTLFTSHPCKLAV